MRAYTRACGRGRAHVIIKGLCSSEAQKRVYGLNAFDPWALFERPHQRRLKCFSTPGPLHKKNSQVPAPHCPVHWTVGETRDSPGAVTLLLNERDESFAGTFTPDEAVEMACAIL